MARTQRDETGQCVVCGRESMFRFDPTIITPQLREAWGISDRLVEAFNRKESMFCGSCGSSLRVRRLAAVLVQTFAESGGLSCKSFAELLENKEFRNLKIAEINACGGLHSYLKDHPNLSYSEWVCDATPGEMRDGVRCEDLQCLTYPDNYFDIILTSETLEHVPDPGKAWQEISRTLKDGGYHIFTIPVLLSQPTTVRRANFVNGKRENFLAPAYHGAWGSENMFVYTDFGMDLVEKLDGIGLKTDLFYQNPEDELDVAVVFRSRKSNNHVSATSGGGSKMLEWTGERYLPWLEDASMNYEHLHRYAYAAEFVQNKRVLDLACGEGYGSYLLAGRAAAVVGIDIDKQTVKHATNKYLKSNLDFKVGSITDIPVEGNNIFDVVVCFEAIEHVEEHESLLKGVKRLLTPAGLFIVSTPNKRTYSDETQRSNPFHLHELYFDEFKELLGSHFKWVNVLGQRIYCNSNIWPLFSPTGRIAEYVIEKGTDEFNFVANEKRVPTYFIAFASDVEETINSVGSLLVDHSNQLLRERDSALNRLQGQFDHSNQLLRERESALNRLQGQFDHSNQLLRERDSALNRLQEQLDTAHRELKRRDEEMKQLSLQWDILLRTTRDLRAKATEFDVAKQQIAQLTEERTQYAQQAADFHAALQAERQTLATIYDTVGWKILDRYRRVRESSKLFSLPHKVLTAPAKKLIARRKNATRVPVSQGDEKGSTDVIGVDNQHQREPVGEPIPFEFAEKLQQGGATEVGGEMESQRPWEPVGEPEPFEFAEVLEPTVSVVIPVYNHAEFTYRCLQSLRSSSITNSFEVIVVDDYSTDETQELLGRMKGIRVVRNEKNSGFILSCNAGAAAARGKYIWFLNNDTLLTPGSLDALVATFLEFPDAGLVGSKLIYPDGKLQEAGGIIWKDASGWNYGRGDDPDKPEYSYLRDVDYCSGASIMIRNSLFHELGGFDRRYLPAYYEDVDLAFTVRKAGRRVLLQPLSRIVHAEGVSSGTDVREGVKSFQQINKDKCYQKWKDTLARHGGPGMNPSWKKDRYAKRRILMIDACTPTPDKDAGSTVVSFYMKIFTSLSCKTTFIPAANLLYLDPYTPDLQSIGVECLYAPNVVDVESHLRERGNEYDIVILFRVQFAAKYIDVVRECCPRALVIFNPIDLHYLREERQAIVESSAELAQQAKQTKVLELETVRKVDGTIVVSEAECEILNREVQGANVTTIPILFSAKGNRAPFDERKDVFYLGGYQHKPNVDAVFYFVRSIWPLVKQKLPEVKFYILGSNVTEEILALATDDVVVVGYVEDLSHYLDRCRMSVVPLRYGAGMKGKIGTSMSYGVPCVATSIAVEGLGLKRGENILVGDTPENFAQEVVTLYTDKRLWEHLSISGLSFVETHWSIKVGERKLTEFLGQLTGTPFCSSVSQEHSADLGKLDLNEIGSGAEYRAYVASVTEQHCKREQIELELITNDHELWMEGFCYVCKEKANFRTTFQHASVGRDGRRVPNWREQLICEKCGLNNRLRASLQIFEERCQPLPTAAIYVTEQLTPLYAWISRNYTNVIGSEYLGNGVTRGATKGDNIRNEDLTQLSFLDAQFDHILSFDVLEHVPDYQRALRECLRCLKPGGNLLFGVPFERSSEKNIVRAKVSSNGEVVHLLEPEYHGDPISPAGVLCFYHFGWELLDQLRTIGFSNVRSYLYWSKELGYLGGEQILFIARKRH
jgi:O-antigen biosynthesis protein